MKRTFLASAFLPALLFLGACDDAPEIKWWGLYKFKTSEQWVYHGGPYDTEDECYDETYPPGNPPVNSFDVSCELVPTFMIE